MLNGIAPIMIFKFPLETGKWAYDALAGVPKVRQFLSDVVEGLPIPIYLDEQLTGLYVDSESKNIDLDIDVKARPDGKAPETKQNAVDSTVSVTFVASKDSILLAVLLALNDLIFTKAATSGYSVTYLNGATTVFNGLVKSFSAQQGDNDSLMHISMVISKANYKAPEPKSDIDSVPKTSTGTRPMNGAVPIPGV